MDAGILKNINTIIFDYGCVISKPQNVDSVREMMNRLGLSDLKQYNKTYALYRREFDAGIISGEAYWEKTARAIKISLTEKDIQWLVNEDMVSWTEIDPEVIQLIVELKSGKFNLAILSNMIAGTLEYLKRNTSFIPLFDHQFFSCNLNLVKPDLRIYRYCLDTMGKRGPECLFIDDIRANCESARNLGIHTIQYKDIDQLRIELNLTDQ